MSDLRRFVRSHVLPLTSQKYLAPADINLPCYRITDDTCIGLAVARLVASPVGPWWVPIPRGNRGVNAATVAFVFFFFFFSLFDSPVGWGGLPGTISSATASTTGGAVGWINLRDDPARSSRGFQTVEPDANLGAESRLAVVVRLALVVIAFSEFPRVN